MRHADPDTMLVQLNKTHPGLLVCNCATCGQLLQARNQDWDADLPEVGGRFRSRPYCEDCLPVVLATAGSIALKAKAS